MTAKSPSSAPRSTGTSSATDRRSRSSSLSIASRGTSGGMRTPSRPLYDFTSGLGLTSTSALKANGSPSAGASSQSMVGRSIGSIPATATARWYQPDRW